MMGLLLPVSRAYARRFPVAWQGTVPAFAVPFEDGELIFAFIQVEK